MELRQVFILMIIAMIFIPFICSLIEEIIKEHISKNKAIRKQNMELRMVLDKMLEEKRYNEYKKINKMQFQNCMIK